MATPRSLKDAIRELRIELVILNDRVARSLGLQPRDLDILDVIDREGPCTPSQVADRVGWSRATMTGVLSRLETDGWIERGTNPSDGRSTTIRSTARFAELTSAYAKADRVVDEAEPSPEIVDFIAEAALRLRAANRLRSRSNRAPEVPGQ